MSTFILGGLLGLFIGLVWCYWRQIQTAYQNRDLISSGSNAVSAVQDFISSAKTKF